MATIFLSYRRTDSPQACRIYDWLVRRFGEDDVFMDVATIPIAVSFSDFIRQAIADSRLMLILIGARWLERIGEDDDPVRAEVETAIAHKIPLLPLLIGNTAMPDPDQLPASIRTMAFRNAVIVGVSRDFHTHMQALLPKIESILGRLAGHSLVMDDPDVIQRACGSVIGFLKEAYARTGIAEWDVVWEVVGPRDFVKSNQLHVTLFLHRLVRLEALLELHFILSFWGYFAVSDHRLAGWVIRQLERHPAIPFALDVNGGEAVAVDLKIRPSDEDPRQIWTMITNEPLRLSLAYVATIDPLREAAGHVPRP
ncbi:hypothetical protein DSCO28_52440 [Desulfosarcina ovata subsp. sediminis]|uniref:Uncharacterized protein n=1 Tax=Desulfosarcina ovata subsp. sediminis TaxID=885957 RepID=A0A5K7ZWS7_9BACT|nr:TIR domain-containing protein [Desulfosarcina ovata]BBO84678.1 hypothetical protein DSCO28_52440 [Desulfosarcina ovata subsp. sediminis]